MPPLTIAQVSPYPWETDNEVNRAIGRTSHALAEELLWSDADDSEARAVNDEVLTDNRRIAVYLLFPVAMTHHRGWLRARFVVFVCEHATTCRAHTEN